MSNPAGNASRGHGHDTPGSRCGRHGGWGAGYHDGPLQCCGNPISEAPATNTSPEEVQKNHSHLQFSLKKLDKVDDYVALDRVAYCHHMAASKLNPHMLLLDSCSTVDIISTTTSPLKVICNASIKQTNLMATFSDFPEPIRFDPYGVANILLLHMVSKHYAITYNSWHNNIFHFSNAAGNTNNFSPTSLGLYAHQGSPGTHWVFLQFPLQTQHCCSTCPSGAKHSHVFIFIHPSVPGYQHIADHNLLPNCSICHSNTARLKQSFGPRDNIKVDDNV